eukprot:462648-Pelagomonas_calceolata.AAC.7
MVFPARECSCAWCCMHLTHVASGAAPAPAPQKCRLRLLRAPGAEVGGCGRPSAGARATRCTHCLRAAGGAGAARAAQTAAASVRTH